MFRIMKKISNSLVITSLIITVILCAAAWITQLNIEKQLRDEFGKSLSTVLNTTNQAIESWALREQNDAMIWANRRKVREATKNLLDMPRNRQTLLSTPVQAELRSWFGPVIESKGHQGYFIIAPDNIGLASGRDENIGTDNLLIQQTEFFNKIWAGKTALSMPLISDVLLADKDGVLRDKLPTMFVGAPIYNEDKKVIAAFTFRIDPRLAFTSILQQGRIGVSGETYAFNHEALMISQSRFDDQLRDIGLVGKKQRGILNVRLLNPGVNLLNGNKSDTPITEQPLTYMASQALEGKSGINTDGYRDYRGVPALGAWTWNRTLKIGITTEIDADEAYESLFYIRHTVIILTTISVFLLAVLTTIFSLDRKRQAKSEKERATLQKQLYQSQKMEAISLLTGGIAHNLNNMLAAVMGYAQLASSEATKLNNKKLISWLDQVTANSNRAVALAKQMLTFSHKKSLELKPKLLHEIILDSIDMLKTIIPPGISIEKQIEDTDAMVMIDGAELHQALINLCINASDAMNDKGEIVIRLRRDIVENKECHSCFKKITGNNAVLEIEDRGHGIEANNLSRLFDPFFTTKDLSEGAGMGLPIVHGIMHEHNGHVQIESELNVGTTIRLYFPICCVCPISTLPGEL